MNPQNTFFVCLIVFNIIACFGMAFPLASMMKNRIGLTKKLKRYYSMLIGIYFLECIAFMFGMCTQVFTVGLAFIWGIILGLWLNGNANPLNAVKTSFWFALYTCAPTISFSFSLPIMWILSAKDLLDVQSAAKFGIPQFAPWPFNTMLGFCAGLAIGTLILKIIITSGLVKLLVRRPA